MRMQLAATPKPAAAAQMKKGKGKKAGGDDGDKVKSASSAVKERTLYFPTTFSGLELIVR